MLDSVIKANKKYYPQTLLEECKYVQEKIKTEKVNQLVTLMVKKNLILIMMNTTNNLLKVF